MGSTTTLVRTLTTGLGLDASAMSTLTEGAGCPTVGRGKAKVTVDGPLPVGAGAMLTTDGAFLRSDAGTARLTVDGAPWSLAGVPMFTVEGAVVVGVCGAATCWRKARAEVQAPPMSTMLRAVVA